MGYALEQQVIDSVSRSIKRKQDIRTASRQKLLSLEIDPSDSQRDRLKKIFIILNVMRLGKISKFENPAHLKFAFNRTFICSNDDQNIFYDKKIRRVPLDAAKYISDLIATFDMHCMNLVCLKSISFECLSIEILVNEDDDSIRNNVLSSIDEKSTRILEKWRHNK